jgi:glucan phosphoethanolaminetransferase (alkaline phosphatase superfamily)
MIPPAGMAIAALTVMLWILWSDSLRSRRPTPVLYAIRVLLFLTMGALLVVNRYRFPWLFTTTSTVLVVMAALVGLFGAFYFGRRLVRRV